LALLISNHLAGPKHSIPPALVNRLHSYLHIPILNPNRLGLPKKFHLRTKIYPSSASIAIYQFHLQEEEELSCSLQYVRKNDTDTHNVHNDCLVSGETSHWMTGGTPYEKEELKHPKKEGNWSGTPEEYLNSIFDFTVGDGDELLTFKEPTDDPRLPPEGNRLLLEDPTLWIVTFNGPPRIILLPDNHVFLLVGAIFTSENEVNAIIVGEQARINFDRKSFERTKEGNVWVEERFRMLRGYRDNRSLVKEVGGKAYYMWDEQDVYYMQNGHW